MKKHNKVYIARIAYIFIAVMNPFSSGCRCHDPTAVVVSFLQRSHCYHSAAVTIPMYFLSLMKVVRGNKLASTRTRHIVAKLRIVKGLSATRIFFFLYQLILRSAIWKKRGGTHS